MAAKLFLKDSKSPLSILLRCPNFSAALRTAAIFSQPVQNSLLFSPRSKGLNFSSSASFLRGFSSGIGKLGGFVDSRLDRKLEYSSTTGKSRRVVDEESDDDSEDVDDSDIEDFVDEDDIDFDEEDSLDDDDDDEDERK